MTETKVSTERNMLIQAHKKAGSAYLAAKLLVLFSPDADPAVRAYILGELSMMLDEKEIAKVARYAARMALRRMKLDTGEHDE